MKSQNLRMSRGPCRSEVLPLGEGIKNKKKNSRNRKPLVDQILECVNTLPQVLLPLGKIGDI